MRLYFYLLIFTIFSFASCEIQLPEGEWSKDPSTTETYQLSLNKTTIVAKAEGSSETFSITSDDSWSISASGSWIKISDAFGAGEKTVTVSVEANTGKDARTGTITVKGKSCGTKSLSVSQEGMSIIYTTSVSKTAISIGSAPTNEIFSITSNESWIASSDVSWATLSATSGSGDNTLNVRIDLNTGPGERIGKITVMGANSGIEKTITITQQPVTRNDYSSFNNGHEYVDLGLPSGLLWATCNVGASKPEEYGDYFSWGATKSQSVYDWAHTPYQTQNTSYSLTKYTKYCGSTTLGFNDSSAKDSDTMKTVLDPEDDAAHVNWGGSWRMPTKAEQDELIDRDNCTWWTWTTQNGVKGYKVTSKKNGNSLFLPAAGYRGGSSLYDVGSHGYYWSSSLFTSNPDYAYYLDFFFSGVGWCRTYGRNYGQSVRPVCMSSE